MFSATVMCGNSASLWNTMLVGRLAAGTPAMSLPAISIRPDVGSSKPAICFNKRRLAAARRADKGYEFTLVDG